METKVPNSTTHDLRKKMFKCGPYIKSLCSSINNPAAWWREGAGGSLPGSPIRQALQQQQQKQQQQLQQQGGWEAPPSPTRSAGFDDSDYDSLTRRRRRPSPIRKDFGSSMPALAHETVVGADGAVALAAQPPGRLRQPPLEQQQPCPQSPDLTKAARTVERARSLGAIPKECSAAGRATSSFSPRISRRGGAGTPPPPPAALAAAALAAAAAIAEEDDEVLIVEEEVVAVQVGR